MPRYASKSSTSGKLSQKFCGSPRLTSAEGKVSVLSYTSWDQDPSRFPWKRSVGHDGELRLDHTDETLP